MPAPEQQPDPGRYTVVPRTAIFLRRGDSFLLIRGAADKKVWPNKYNGIGGHIERGEDMLSSAARELREEAGVDADLWLCGTVLVDAGEIGIGLYVLAGEVVGGAVKPSAEGIPEWIDFERLAALPVVPDVISLLGRIRGMQRGDPPFSARSYYDQHGNLQLEFHE
jgi:8-oxo-dGTP diphosphatase